MISQTFRRCKLLQKEGGKEKKKKRKTCHHTFPPYDLRVANYKPVGLMKKFPSLTTHCFQVLCARVKDCIQSDLPAPRCFLSVSALGQIKLARPVLFSCGPPTLFSGEGASAVDRRNGGIVVALLKTCLFVLLTTSVSSLFHGKLCFPWFHFILLS